MKVIDKILVEIHPSTVVELYPYYERYNELFTQAGISDLSEYTFEEYIKYVLILGCKDHMLSNAKSMEMLLKWHIANQKGADKNG